MDKIEICGGKKLYGTLSISSSKNAILPILAGSILCNGKVVLKNIPEFEDIKNMCNILQTLGADITKKNGTLELNCKNICNFELPECQTKLLRSSIFCLGPMLARLKKAKISYPGGCAIGARPIDLHIEGLKILGVKIDEQDSFLMCDGENMKANDIHLRFASVGATENLMMACCCAKGISHIFNPAREPEIVDLQNFLNSMGAKISGAGTKRITIKGSEDFCSTIYTPIPDRIITGTFLTAVAMTGGKVTLKNTKAEHLKSLIQKIENKCCKIQVDSDKIIVQGDGCPKSFGHIQTKPYPGFPTDLQSQMVALACVCKGKSCVTENLFETRFKHVPQLQKMGADITVDGKVATINGGFLHGAQVTATDLRSGACLVCAGLAANGKTTVSDVHHIDRGYQKIEQDFASLGADIKRIKIEEESDNNI